MTALARDIFAANLVRSFAKLGFTVEGRPVMQASVSRNKREGRYAGKTMFDWQYVTGWGMAGYAGESRHNRSRYRCLKGLV